MTPRLSLASITQKDAKMFVAEHHRHHRPPLGSIFQVSVVDATGRTRGVAMVGRPVARMLQDGRTAEVIRVCTDGVQNGCSMLYSACWRAAKALGYRRLITYTLPSEGGASLRAANWRLAGEAGGGSWSSEKRPRVDKHPTERKLRWEVP